jgi:hypothetical protein
MATVRHVFMLDYVAEILGEHPDLIHAIVSNDDNLTWAPSSASALGRTTCAAPSPTMASTNYAP